MSICVTVFCLHRRRCRLQMSQQLVSPGPPGGGIGAVYSNLDVATATGQTLAASPATDLARESPTGAGGGKAKAAPPSFLGVDVENAREVQEELTNHVMLMQDSEQDSICCHKAYCGTSRCCRRTKGACFCRCPGGCCCRCYQPTKHCTLTLGITFVLVLLIAVFVFVTVYGTLKL